MTNRENHRGPSDEQSIAEQKKVEQAVHSASFFFASPAQTLLARQMHATLSGHSDLNALTNQIRLLHDIAQQAGINDQVVVGAIPFDHRHPVYLGVPEKFQRLPPFQRYRRQPSSTATPAPKITLVPEPDVYKHSVKAALSSFERRELDKVVLSRTLEVQNDQPFNTSQVLLNMAADNCRGYTFGITLPNGEQQPATTLLGASPELLVSRQGLTVRANPLAGSAVRSADPAEDQRRAEELLNSAKDLHEHAVVIDAVATALSPFCRDFKVPERPSLIKTKTLWHLSTVIEGQLINPDTSSLELAAALHPTPAVCGYPTRKAREFILKQEPFDRGFFTGMVGWCDSAGNGEWVVTIRCAEVTGHRARLYAGAGVVKGSDPDKELAETGAKFRTMLNALGLGQAAINTDATTDHQKTGDAQ